MPYRTLIYSICIFAIFYSFCYFFNIFPIEHRTNPYAIENPVPEKRYSYYIITDEDGTTELMKIPILVHIGDEVLSTDNKLYEVTRIEENHAYAKFVRQIKL